MKNDKNIFRGNLTAEAGVVYQYKEITGNVYAEGAAAGAFPKLTTAGGYVYARGAAAGAFPKLTTAGGYVYAEGAAAGAFPKLTNKNDPSAITTCRNRLFLDNLKIGYYYADGILARLVNRKGRVARVVICGKTAMSYVVDDGRGNFSHGATLDEARNGLIYKLSSRDTTPFKKWTRKTVVSLAYAIKAYRAITGACELGTKNFCDQQGKLPKKLKISDAITLTKGQFGADVFAKFFVAK
jgi:hypothetical protein